MILGVFSIEVVTLATVTDACAGSVIYNPLTELQIPKFLEGQFSYTLGTVVFGLPPYVSVALYYVILVGGVWWIWKTLPPEPEERRMANPNAIGR